MTTRRQFIATSAASLAATTLPAAAWQRVAGANDRLAMAVIGTGGMGTHHTRSLVERADRDNVDVVGVCDVYRRRLDNAVAITGGDADSGTMEYREILDRADVDAVLIATPDHWHTKIAIEAMDAGKDVYVEKPLSLTIEQALQCRDAVRRTGRTLQVGPQGTSSDEYWRARKAIAAGRIGPVTWSQAAYCRNSRNGQFNWGIDPDAGPHQSRDATGYVWWDRWLGHEWGLAEHIPWNPDHFFRFRKYWAYNGGVATDLLYHKLAPLLIAIEGPHGAYPRRVSAGGGQYIETDGRDIADTFMMTVDYRDHTILLVSVMTNDAGLPDVIRGRYGTMELGNPITVREQNQWAPEFRAANEGMFVHRTIKDEEGREQHDPPYGDASFTLEPSERRDHMGNFLDAVRGEATLHCPVELGCATMVAIKMGVEAYRQSRTLTWDAEAECVVG